MTMKYEGFEELYKANKERMVKAAKAADDLIADPVVTRTTARDDEAYRKLELELHGMKASSDHYREHCFYLEKRIEAMDIELEGKSDSAELAKLIMEDTPAERLLAKLVPLEKPLLNHRNSDHRHALLAVAVIIEEAKSILPKRKRTYEAFEEEKDKTLE